MLSGWGDDHDLSITAVSLVARNLRVAVEIQSELYVSLHVKNSDWDIRDMEFSKPSIHGACGINLIQNARRRFEEKTQSQDNGQQCRKM